MRRLAFAVTALLIFVVGCSGGSAPKGSPAPVPGPAPGQAGPAGTAPDPGQTPSQPAGPSAGGKSQAPPRTTDYDLVLRGGTLVDGTGRPGHKGDIAVRDGRIVAVGSVPKGTTLREIDASALVVAPGFINPHSHTHDYINPYEDLDATASLMQGITTEFGGVDGRSPLPVSSLLEKLQAEGTGVNFGTFVGQGSVRGNVMGNATGVASATQLEAMKRLVRQGMEEGAFGLSTGLEYVPGMYAGEAEIAALAAEVKPYGGIYSTHMRSEGNSIVEALREALAIGRASGIPVEISHFKIVRYPNWSKEDQVFALVQQALDGGQKVFADVYPYLSPDYGINRPLSAWWEDGRLAGQPADSVVIVKARDRSLVGKSLTEAAKAMNLPPDEAARKLTAADSSITVVVQISSEKAMLRFYQAPWSVVSTDDESQPKLSDPVAALQFHPRSYGTYPRLLGTYVREQRLLPMEAMVRKMTGAVADSLGLKDRGYLVKGGYADITVFDPGRVADRTTWLSPQEYPDGIRYVVVNGQLVVDGGRRTAGPDGQPVRAGVPLRHGS